MNSFTPLKNEISLYKINIYDYSSTLTVLVADNSLLSFTIPEDGGGVAKDEGSEGAACHLSANVDDPGFLNVQAGVLEVPSFC